MKKIGVLFIIILIIIFSFNTAFAAKYKGDLNNDNVVDMLDVRLLLQEYITNER
jgi:hypothetical protein